MDALMWVYNGMRYAYNGVSGLFIRDLEDLPGPGGRVAQVASPAGRYDKNFARHD